MKFNVSLDGVTVPKEIPDRWSQVTFRMFLSIMDIPNDEASKLLAALTGIEEEVLRKVKIAGLDEVLRSLSFMRTTPMTLAVPETILGHTVPKNLLWETTGQFKDCQAISNTIVPTGEKGNEKLSCADQEKYLTLVAIYTMPNYLDATSAEQEAFAQQFYDAPCEEVLAIGNFTLLKLIALKMNTGSEHRSKSGPLKKLRLAFRLWRLNMGLSIRFWLLRNTLKQQTTK